MFFVFHSIQQLLANCGHEKLLQSCLTLCDPVDCSLPDPLEEGMAPTPRFLTGESHGQRNLAGYSPCGHKQLDMTEHTLQAFTK